MEENVPLHCGTVKPLANLYVGSHNLEGAASIKAQVENELDLPPPHPSLSQSMNTPSTLYPGTENSTLPLRPTGLQPVLLLHSELIEAALGDASFLGRSNNLHTLTLSSASGFQFGPGRDLAQHTYIDYNFLHSGLIDSTSDTPTVAPANTFV